MWAKISGERTCADEVAQVPVVPGGLDAVEDTRHCHRPRTSRFRIRPRSSSRRRAVNEGSGRSANASPGGAPARSGSASLSMRATGTRLLLSSVVRPRLGIAAGGCASSETGDRPESAAEPAGAPARAEVLLLGDQGGGGLLEGAGRPRAREEVDVDAPDPAGAELDVAGARAGRSPRARPPPRNRAINDAATTRAAPSAKTPAFGTPTVATSPIAYTPGNRVSSVLRIDRHVAVLGHPAREDDVGGAMLRDAEEEVVGKLASVVEHRDLAGGVEGAHAAAGDELDPALGERPDQRLPRCRATAGPVSRTGSRS